MKLKDLTSEVMLSISSVWIDPQREDRAVLASDPVIKPFLSKLDGVHAKLLATQPTAGANAETAEALQALAAGFDLRHDRKARGLIYVLRGAAELSDSPEDQAAFDDALRALFPDRLSVTQRTYAEEAGNAEETSARVTPAIRKALDTVQVSGQGLSTHLDQWLEAAQQLGAVQAKRDRLNATSDATKVSPAQARDARNAWVRTTRTLVDLLKQSDTISATDQDRVLSSLRRALERR